MNDHGGGFSSGGDHGSHHSSSHHSHSSSSSHSDHSRPSHHSAPVEHKSHQPSNHKYDSSTDPVVPTPVDQGTSYAVARAREQERARRRREGSIEGTPTHTEAFDKVRVARSEYPVPKPKAPWYKRMFGRG